MVIIGIKSFLSIFVQEQQGKVYKYLEKINIVCIQSQNKPFVLSNMLHHSSSSSYSQTTISSSHSHSSASLSIHVSSATELVSAQTFGKQDPYLQFSLDFNEKDSFLKTFTHKNAGENATWNQTFTISLNGESDLFVEVLDEESTVNEVIGFAAIPINQVVHAPGANMNGLFEIYDTKGEKAGLLNLQLAAIGFPNSQPPNFEDSQPVQGQSYVHEGHCARMKSSKKKATGVAVGGALLGGALAIGAGFLGKKLYDDHNEKQEEEERQEQEAQRLRDEEEQKRQQEREEFDQEKARYQQEKEEYERQKNSHRGDDDENNHQEQEHGRRHNDDDEECEGRHHRRRDSNSSDEGDAKKWNPVGTYAAGDRVKYHGQVYMCLQGHTSNPTWQPGAAHSLWQAE